MPKKIINLPEDCVSEAMEGFLAANKDYVQVEGASAIRVRNLKDKPAMIVGGGSGHEPMFGYFVGENLADASVAGSVFTPAASFRPPRPWTGARVSSSSTATIPATT